MSTAIPFFNLVLCLVILASLVGQRWFMALLLFLLLLVVPAVYLLRRGQAPEGAKSAVQHYLVAADYVAARTVAFLAECFDLAFSGKG